MNASTKARRLVAKSIVLGAVLCVGIADVHAQDHWCGPACESNAQFFAPVDFDYDCLPIRKDCGVFFNYSRLAWVWTGEKTEIGAPGQTAQSEIIYPDATGNDGDPPPTFTVVNGIREAKPDGDFGWGHRYELGFFDGQAGWMVGVMDGPRVTTSDFFGFEQIEIPNRLPLVLEGNNVNFGEGIAPFLAGLLDIDPAEGTIVLAQGAGSANLSTARNGFGSVHVNFITPEGYLLGFRDYWVNGIADVDEDDLFVEQGQFTIGGPSRQLLPAEITTVTGPDGQVVIVEISDGTTQRGADGEVDDLDGDGFPGFILMIDVNGNLIVGTDFDDLHMFNVVFDSLRTRNTIESHSVELMRTHELDNGWMFKKRQNNSLHIGYGVRFFNLDDTFYWEGKGGILGRTVVNTVAENQIIGPQIRAAYRTQRGRWGLNLDGRFVFGYNVQDINQDSNMGEDLISGSINKPIAADPTTTSISRRDDDFSPMIEFRAEGSYQLTSSIALKLGYTGMFIDNITRGSQVVVYSLPNMGLSQGGQQDIMAHGADFGIEAVY